jgi:outer membrane receptor protein involved in Fe transport
MRQLVSLANDKKRAYAFFNLNRLGGTMFEGPRKVLHAVFLTTTALSAVAFARPAFADGVSQPQAVEEITVTAEKREETSMNVPMSLSALTGDDLARAQAFRFQDYINTIPGVQLVQSQGLTSMLVIRGIGNGTGSINSSVATYIDETPYTADGTFAGSTRVTPNLDTFDMQRIEVLRGPQGTLYGSNALGGLLKYVTNAPDPSGFAATVEAGVDSVADGGRGFDLHGMVNMPLSTDAALRVVVYDDYYPGFIDDPSRGLKNINGSRFTGGRASLLYAPTADFSIRLNALYQVQQNSDLGDEDVAPGTLKPLYGNLTQERLISQPFSTKDQLYNATINWNLGFANLLSSTSYAHYQLYALTDYSASYGGFVSSLLGTSYGVAYPNQTSANKFTQEVRLASEGEGQLEWQVGGFVTDQTAKNSALLFPIDPVTKQILYSFPSNVGADYFRPHYAEYAGFANIDYHFTSTLDASFGGRYSHNSQTFVEKGLGLLGAADFGTKSSEDVATFSGDVRWKLDEQNMLYGRIARGFVPGGPNDAVPGGALPESYGSSSTMNYEVGIKSHLWNDRFTTEVSLFDVDWKKIQLIALVSGQATITNGGAAQSDGVEWNFGFVPVDGLTLNFNGAYTDARLTQDTPAYVNGQKGDLLPYAPKWGMSASANYEVPLSDEIAGFAGATWHFTGNRYADFIPPGGGSRQNLPSYGIADLRVGIETSRWTAALYVKNVGDETAVTSAYGEILGYGIGPQAAGAYQPRMIGIDLTARF